MFTLLSRQVSLQVESRQPRPQNVEKQKPQLAADAFVETDQLLFPLVA